MTSLSWAIALASFLLTADVNRPDRVKTVRAAFGALCLTMLIVSTFWEFTH